MKSRLPAIAAVFLVLTSLLPITAPAQAQSAPQITLVHPALSAVQLGSGAPNVISVSVSSPGSTITSAEYQFLFGEPATTMVATEVFAQQPGLSVVPEPTAGVGATADNTAIPQGVPQDSIVEMVIWGTVTGVNSATGEWRIGTPPVLVYESQSTNRQGNPAVGDAVRVQAVRTLAPGPIVASVVSRLAGGVSTTAPTIDVSFLVNGTVQSVQTPVQSAGIKVGGTTWTMGTAAFRTDAPSSPAFIDQGVGPNSAVTMRFTTATAGGAINTALEISAQETANLTPVHPNPVANSELSPLDLPAGAWRQSEIAGVVSGANANGEWLIGTPPVAVYEHAATQFSGSRLPTVGDEVRILANRTAAPGPLVAARIDFRRGGPLAQAPASVSSTLLFNGTVQATGADTWTVGGASFAVSEADIRSGVGMGSAVTVEFTSAGPLPPDEARWAPLALDPATGRRSAVLSVPAVNADRAGTLFLRASNAQQQVTTTVLAASLLAVPAAAPAAPTNLSAASGPQVTVTWTDNSTNEASFKLQRSSDSFATYTELAILPANTQGFTDTTVTQGTTYFYRIVAVNGAGSTMSTPASVTIPSPQPQATPTTQPQQSQPQPTAAPAPTATPIPAPTVIPQAQVVPVPVKAGETLAIIQPDTEGKVELEDRTVITVPPLALGATAQMKARAVPEVELPKPLTRGKVTKAVEIEVFDDKGGKIESVEIRLPITIEVPLSADDLAAIGDDPNNVELHRYDEGLGVWVKLASELDLSKKVVRAQLRHLSLFAVVVPAPVAQVQPTPTAAPPSAGGQVPGASAWLVALVVGLGILLFGYRLLRGAREPIKKD
ncbi:MAG: hypothetical protein HYY01_15285 [Chloroflexi bacterium]|nr:hypothetical protein [Chloroflexota bacterium]